MNTAYPAAGPADTLLEFANQSFDMVFPRLFLFDGNNPANPFIAG